MLIVGALGFRVSAEVGARGRGVIDHRRRDACAGTIALEALLECRAQIVLAHGKGRRCAKRNTSKAEAMRSDGSSQSWYWIKISPQASGAPLPGKWGFAQENMLKDREPIVAPEHLRTDKRRHSKREPVRFLAVGVHASRFSHEAKGHRLAFCYRRPRLDAAALHPLRR